MQKIQSQDQHQQKPLKGFRFNVDPLLGKSRFQRLRDQVRQLGGQCVTGDQNQVPYFLITHRRPPKDSDLLQSAMTPEWLEACAQSGNWESVEFYSPDPQSLFTGWRVAVLPAPDYEQQSANPEDSIYNIPLTDLWILRAGLESFGGQFFMDWTLEMGKPTHFISLRDPENLFQTADQMVLETVQDVPVLLPHYFEDCFNLRRRLPLDEYLFPNPDLLRPDAPRTSTELNRVYGTERTIAIPPAPAEPFLSEPLCFYFQVDDQTRLELIEAYKQHLKLAGAKIASQYSKEKVDCVVLNFRDGALYKTALEDGKIVGTIYWVLDILRTKSIPDPTQKLLNYPWPDQPIPEMKNFTISLTNYTNSSREILKIMLARMGAKYTSSLSTANTHLICAAAEGQKYEHAVNWNINVMNHLWIEDCWQNWKVQSVTKPHYMIHRTSLSRVVADVPVDMEMIRILDQALWSSQSAEACDIAVEASTVVGGAAECDEDDEENKSPDQRGRSIDKSQILKSAGDDIPYESDEPNDIIINVAKKRSREIEESGKRKRQRGNRSRCTLPIKIMTTVIALSADELSDLEKMGVHQAGNIEEATHLVSDKAVRTEKFINAIACCQYIVTSSWVHDSIQAGYVLDEENYALKDIFNERNRNFVLSDSMRHVKRHGSVLKSCKFVATPRLPLDRDILSNIIRVHGGQLLTVSFTKRALKNLNDPSILVLSCEEDRHLWKLLIDAGHNLYSHDLVLNGCLRQRLELDRYCLNS